MESIAPETRDPSHDEGPATVPSGLPDSELLERSSVTPRRRFVATAGGLVAAAAATIVDAPYVIAQPKVQWRLSTAWTPAILYQRAAEQLAKVVEEVSGGRFRIDVFPGGQIMEPFDCFDATAQGKIEAFHAGALFWDTKVISGP